MSTQLVWQLINKHNSFKVKNRTGDRVILSSEPGNLYNKHSYKHSGIANDKTIDLQAGEKNAIIITTSKPKNANRPLSSKQSYSTKKDSRRAASSIAKETKKIRPDLQKAAKARIGAIRKSQRKQAAIARKSS